MRVIQHQDAPGADLTDPDETLPIDLAADVRQAIEAMLIQHLDDLSADTPADGGVE
ncbi:MAG: hypothetical protein AAF677_05285 [Pseudomonadota bacterium]